MEYIVISTVIGYMIGSLIPSDGKFDGKGGLKVTKYAHKNGAIAGAFIGACISLLLK